MGVAGVSTASARVVPPRRQRRALPAARPLPSHSSRRGSTPATPPHPPAAPPAAMYVIKRDGRTEPVHFDKITARITKLSYGLNPDFCDPVREEVEGMGRGGEAARRAAARRPAVARAIGAPGAGLPARAAALAPSPGAARPRAASAPAPAWRAGAARVRGAPGRLFETPRAAARPPRRPPPPPSPRRDRAFIVAARGRGGSRIRGCRSASVARPRRPPIPSSLPQVLVAQKVATGVYKGVTTSELDELAAETAASMTANHPDYAVVREEGGAGRRAQRGEDGRRRSYSPFL